MDKRYFLIIFIIVIGCINLFVISNYSDIIGTASADFNEVTFSLPPNYELIDTNPKYIQFHNPSLGYMALSYFNGSAENAYNKTIDQINNSSDKTLLSYGVVNKEDTPIYSVFWESTNKNNKVNNESSFYFNELGFCFRIDMGSFKYEDRNSTIDTVIFIVESMRLNLKQ